MQLTFQMLAYLQQWLHLISAVYVSIGGTTASSNVIMLINMKLEPWFPLDGELVCFL